MATVAPEIPVLASDEAFEKLYRRYVKDVYHYALALLRNPADAEDVTQTTFMNAYRAFRRGQEIEKPHNWLIKIAHNVARSRYAHSTRRVKEVPLEDHVDQLAVAEEERPDVEGVLRALGRLPFNQRAALVMRELEGKSYAEIADTLGVSVAAVETLIFRARRSLKVRASALRSLTSVPLPASLTQLFGGGGTVAGGGVLFGGGFVIKAAVALLAGALATGIGGSRGGKADAAPAVSPPSVAHGSTTATSGHGAAQTTKVQQLSHAVVRGRNARSPEITLPGFSPTGGAVGRSPSPGAVGTGSSAPPSTPTIPTSLPATATTTVANTVDTVVDTVDSTVSTVTSALPVQPPPLPPLPVQPPALPKLP